MESGNDEHTSTVQTSFEFDCDGRKNLLFQHFCNCLYLGQWELAKSCVKQLHLNCQHEEGFICAILKDIVRQPFNRSILSASVSTPCQLSWLCLLECEKFSHGFQSQTEDSIPDRKLVEFHLLLIDVCPYITDTHLKEVYLYYRWVHSGINVSHPLLLSSGLLKFLQTLLLRQPSLGHSLIEALYKSGNSQLSKNNKALQMVYVNSVNTLLDSFTQEDLDKDVKLDKSEILYEILANFDLEVSTSQLPVRQMIAKILEHCQLDAEFISKTRIASVLIGHQDLHLLEEFCRLDYETETNKAVSTYQACAELTEEQRWILHLSTLSKINTRWKMFLMFAMKRKRHVLEVILETGLALIKCSMFSELERLMEPEELRPLKPLLLLLGWTHCYSSSEARQLLQTLWSDKNECEHPALTMGCNKLAYQIDLIQWCLDKAKPLLSEDSGGPQFQRAADLFKGLESHSVLYVLQNSTKLSSLDQQEVLELLQKVPLQGQKDDPDTEIKKTKTVRFQEEVDSAAKIPATSLDQRKDMAIFTGYCVLKNVMDAILFCAECTDKRLTNPVRSRSRRRISNRTGSESSLDSSGRSRRNSLTSTCDSSVHDRLFMNVENQNEKLNVNIQSLYKEMVTNKLSQTKMFLSKLQPLTFRVEILENIFSLLFLTHEDVQETLLLSEYDSDEADDRSLSKSGSVGLMTPLLSPLKGSLEIKVSEVLIDKFSPKESNLDYDVPFEEANNVETSARKEVDMYKVEEALESMKSAIEEKKQKLREDPLREGRHSSVSENISSMSASSSLNLDTVGFISNDYIVRDILAMLKDCILDVSAAKFQLYGNKADARERYRSSREVTPAKSVEIDVNTEEALCRLVRSSVSMDTLQKRTAQLERYTSEAHWRFQLVSDEHIPRSPGEVLQDVVMTTGDSSDEEVEIKGHGPGQSSKKRKRTASGRKSPQTAQDINRQISAEPKSAGGNNSSQTSNIVVARRPLGQVRSPKLVSMMLASPVTLLTMSIRKGQLTQTKQIIKLFKLEDTPEAVEVYFSQAYHKACRSIQGIMGKDSHSSGTTASKAGLKAIASAAAAGLATASVTDVADDILKFPTIPKIPKIVFSDNLPQNIAQIFHQENIPVMILLDLMCTSAKTWDVCNHLLDTIKSHQLPVPRCKADDSAQSLEPKSTVTISRQRVTKIRTFPDIVAQFQCLLQLGAEDQIPSKEQTTLARTFQKGIQYYLSNATLSLTAEKSKQFEILSKNLSRFVTKVVEAFEHSNVKGQSSPTRSEVRQRLGSTGSQSSWSKQDKPVIHHCMKQLINTLEKEVPSGGVVALISRSSSSRRNRNYLLSLYEHCKELAYLVAESESQSKETMVIPSNYFAILEEGPLRILGRMMFKKKMAPSKLEKVAAKLSLNLTHIIVYSCCMKIPSKRLPLLQVTAGQEGFETKVSNGKVIYNVAKVTELDIIGNPEEFVRNLLTRLVSIMKEVAGSCNAQGLFDLTCASLLTKNTDFYDIIRQTAVLQSADLLQLDKKERKCFYGNLLTLMTIHCHVHHLWMIENQKSEVNPSKRNVVLKQYSEMSATEQITFLSMFSYTVGQLGDISIFDLRYQNNRLGLLAPSEWGRTLEHRLHPLDESDPWHQLAPSVNPQMLFAVTSCSLSSPPIQILNPANVTEQLQTSMKDYLQTSVQIDTESKQVKIPELLLWYRRDFISLLGASEIAGENDGLLAFIESHLSGEKEANLKYVIKETEYSPKKESELGKEDKLQVHIEVIHHKKDFMCVFDYESMRHALQAEASFGELKNTAGDTAVDDSDVTYNLTPNTLEYIKSDCPLVATLASLMCSDDIEENFIDDAFDESHFNASGSISSFESSQQSFLQLSFNRTRTSSSMSTLDLKSYRYEKLTNEYPALKRHLLNYIIPLAATEEPDILKGDDPILKLLTHDIVERFKTNMLSLHESTGFRQLLTGLLDELFKLRKWKEVLQVIDSVPVTVLRNQTSLCSLCDFVVCCLIHKQCSVGDNKRTLSKEKSEEIMILLNRIFSADGQAREILTVHHKLQIDHNIDLFRMCLGRSDLSSSLREAMQQKFKQIQVFHRITECAKNLQFKLSLQRSGFVTEEDKMAAKKRHDILDKFTDWHTVVEWTKKSPREVLGLLIKSGDFETAKTWSILEKLDDDIKQEIEENHVISLLNLQPPNTTKAFMVLENLRMKGKETCLAMCQKFLGVFNKQQDVLFIASYILNQMAGDLDQKELDAVRLTRIGARMILCLPESMHIEYCHLVATPRYILEQLIMNMKPELASKAFQTVKDEFCLIKEPGNKFTTEQFNTLVAFYAKKALEFTVIQYIEDKDRSFSVKSSSSDKLESDARDSPQFRHSPQPRHDLTHLKRRSIDLQGSRLAASAPHTSSSPVTKATSVTKETVFVMPSEPPPREQWVPDSATSVCMVCKVETFSMFNRRHHCRQCGRVVCASCSEKVTPIRGINARTCDDCYREIVKSSEGDRRTSAAEIYQQYRLSDSSMPSSPIAAVHNSMITAIQEGATKESLSQVISHSHTAWKLQTDNTYNANLREDFYFEQRPFLALKRWQQVSRCGNIVHHKCAMAPSTSLCISILNLHGSGRECGRLILGMCDDLSKFLKPLAPGVPNPEVDYNLVMSMMKYLLFHAKIKFTSCGDNAGMGQCDKYQGLVDLLALLVIDNYRDLPSIEELTKVDSVRRLRDKLIGDERLSLAMEVSTKCGLDPTGVWVAWGMMCLQSGDFPGAREKFSKCLKSVKDKNICSPLPKVLNDVIECLESMPGTGAMEIQVLLANPGSMKNLINTPSSTFFEEASMDSKQFQECLYYLRTYGTYISLVEFHRRHGYYMKAVQYILDHKCSVEVFVEGLLKPSVETGELGRLTDQMLIIDPSLDKWNSYLTASCRYFVKHRLHHVLYEFQLFMKDFIRAGMTCFTYFYQDGAQSYLDLARRINHLFTAQQHMQAYLDPTHWGNVQHPLSVPQRQGSWEEKESKGEHVSVRLVKGPEDVSRYIKTIALQIEVTKFFQSCLTNSTGEAASAAMSTVGSSKVPTLFGNQQARNDLAIMILMCGDNIETSFVLATRIIKEYKLGAVGIYTHVAREFAKGHHYDNMRSLLKCVEKMDIATDDVMDEILGACLLVVADNASEAKEAENIIKMLRKDANKINAYILCGKLRSAYLMAVKENRVDDVRRILRAAKSMGQSAVVNICNKWLEQNQK